MFNPKGGDDEACVTGREATRGRGEKKLTFRALDHRSTRQGGLIFARRVYALGDGGRSEKKRELKYQTRGIEVKDRNGSGTKQLK